MLKKNLPEKENFIVHAAKRWYEPALAWALRRKKTVLAIAVASLAGSLALVPQPRQRFLPES